MNPLSDAPKARPWRQIAVALCFVASAATASLAFAEDLHRVRDYGEGLTWHLNAAESGDAEAQYRLGRFYEAGIKTASEPGQARYWYGEAAEQGQTQQAIRRRPLGRKDTMLVTSRDEHV